MLSPSAQAPAQSTAPTRMSPTPLQLPARYSAAMITALSPVTAAAARSDTPRGSVVATV